MPVPNVANGSEGLGGVEPTSGLVHTDGVEVSDGRVLFLQITVPADDAAAISHDAHDATVFPVADLLMVGPLQELQKLVTLIFSCVGHFFNLRDEAGPRTLFQLVQHRGTSF